MVILKKKEFEKIEVEINSLKSEAVVLKNTINLLKKENKTNNSVIKELLKKVEEISTTLENIIEENKTTKSTRKIINEIFFGEET